MGSPLRTLTAKLVLSYVGLSLGLNVVLVLVLSVALAGGMRQGIDTFLVGFASGIIESDPPTEHDVEAARQGVTDGEGLRDGFCMRYAGPDGLEVFSAGMVRANVVLREAQFSDAVRVGEFETRTITLNEGDELRVITRRFLDGATLQVGALIVHDDALRGRVLRLGLIAVGGLSLVAASIGWFFARSAMAAVKQVTATAQEIMEGSLGLRVPVAGASSEVAELATAFNRMLERIEQLLDDVRRVAADMVHDLRSPLTRMRAQAECFLREPGDGYRGQELAEKTIEETILMDRLVQETLDVVALDSGVYTPQLTTVNFAEIVDGVLELFQPLVETERANLDVRLQSSVAAPVDASMLQRVLANIIDNALKFNTKNGTIRVSVFNSSGASVITVEDSGPGIPEGERRRVFERFYRLERSRGTKGHGLGLSYVKAAMQAMGGSVDLSDSDLGGVLVRIAFP